jgi:hypothetical protein
MSRAEDKWDAGELDYKAERDQPTHREYLIELAERLMSIPVAYGVDQGDVERLREIAKVIP